MRTEKMIDDEIRERYAEIAGRDEAIIRMINSWPLPAAIAARDQVKPAQNVRDLKRRMK
jgi:hypothetical protein